MVLCKNINEHDCLQTNYASHIYSPKPTEIDKEYFYELTLLLEKLFKENNISIKLCNKPETPMDKSAINEINDILADMCEEEYGIICYSCKGEIPLMVPTYTHELDTCILCDDCHKNTNYIYKDIMEQQTCNYFSNKCHNCNTSIKKNVVFYEIYTYKLCPECYKSSNYKDSLIINFDDFNYGSIMDWFFLTDTIELDSVTLMCNLNKKSKYYKNFALVLLDSHVRCGYYNLNFSDPTKLLEELNKTLKFKKREICNEKDEYYSDSDEKIKQNITKENKVNILDIYALYKGFINNFG